MTPETQEKLITLAHRGAKCEAWAEWCKMALERSATTGGLDVNDRRVKSEYRPAWYYIGPLPSCTYLDDQLGEFLWWTTTPYPQFGHEDGLLVYCSLDWVMAKAGHVSLLDKLEAAVTLVERAHRLGEYAHYSETEAEPYLAAFNRGIGK